MRGAMPCVPERDQLGRRRIGPCDIGAIEFRDQDDRQHDEKDDQHDQDPPTAVIAGPPRRRGARVSRRRQRVSVAPRARFPLSSVKGFPPPRSFAWAGWAVTRSIVGRTRRCRTPYFFISSTRSPTGGVTLRFCTHDHGAEIFLTPKCRPGVGVRVAVVDDHQGLPCSAVMGLRCWKCHALVIHLALTTRLALTPTCRHGRALDVRYSEGTLTSQLPALPCSVCNMWLSRPMCLRKGDATHGGAWRACHRAPSHGCMECKARRSPRRSNSLRTAIPAGAARRGRDVAVRWGRQCGDDDSKGARGGHSTTSALRPVVRKNTSRRTKKLDSPRAAPRTIPLSRHAPDV